MRIASVADVKAHLSSLLRDADKGPLIVTRNGRPVAVLLPVHDEDETSRLVLAYSPQFNAILDAARQRILETGGIPHDEFWRQVEREQGSDAQSGNQRKLDLAPAAARGGLQAPVE